MNKLLSKSLLSRIFATPSGSFDNAVVRSGVNFRIALTSGDELAAIFSDGPGSEL